MIFVDLRRTKHASIVYQQERDWIISHVYLQTQWKRSETAKVKHNTINLPHRQYYSTYKKIIIKERSEYIKWQILWEYLVHDLCYLFSAGVFLWLHFQSYFQSLSFCFRFLSFSQAKPPFPCQHTHIHKHTSEHSMFKWVFFCLVTWRYTSWAIFLLKRMWMCLPRQNFIHNAKALFVWLLKYAVLWDDILES